MYNKGVSIYFNLYYYRGEAEMLKNSNFSYPGYFLIFCWFIILLWYLTQSYLTQSTLQTRYKSFTHNIPIIVQTKGGKHGNTKEQEQNEYSI